MSTTMTTIRKLSIAIAGLCLVSALAWPARAAAKTAPAIARPRVAAMLYIWTQHFKGQGGGLDEHLDEALAATARAGFPAVEGWLDYFATPEKAAATSAMLTKHGLAMRAAYTGGKLHEEPAAQATIDGVLARAAVAKAHGLDVVVMNPDVIGREKNDEELAVQSRALDRLGAGLRKLGLQFAIHTHDKEMRSNAREWFHILKYTKKDNVGFCLDLHWVLRGGQDPLALLKAAGARVVDLHLRNSQDGVWSEDFGPGDIDHSKVAAQLAAAKYRGLYTVELAYEAKTQKTRTLEQDLARSRAYVKEVFGQ